MLIELPKPPVNVSSNICFLRIIGFYPIHPDPPSCFHVYYRCSYDLQAYILQDINHPSSYPKIIEFIMNVTSDMLLGLFSRKGFRNHGIKLGII